MEKRYNIIITFEGLDISFQLELRKILKEYDVNYTMTDMINIINADKKLIEHLEQWDIIIKENI